MGSDKEYNDYIKKMKAEIKDMLMPHTKSDYSSLGERGCKDILNKFYCKHSDDINDILELHYKEVPVFSIDETISGLVKSFLSAINASENIKMKNQAAPGKHKGLEERIKELESSLGKAHQKIRKLQEKNTSMGEDKSITTQMRIDIRESALRFASSVSIGMSITYTLSTEDSNATECACHNSSGKQLEMARTFENYILNG